MTEHPAAPRRGHFLALALAFSLIALYGSLIPLHYARMEWSEAVQWFGIYAGNRLGFNHPSDWAANILLFVPIGFCWLAVLTLDRGGFVWRRVAAAGVLAACAVFSATLEFLQLWFPPRMTSLNDFAAETIGAAVGIVLWLAVGGAITDWLRWFTTSSRRKDRIDWLLQAYCVGLVVYAMLPLDLSVSPGELASKYRQGRVVLRPFSDVRPSGPSVAALWTDVAAFVPVGMYVAVAATSIRRPVRSWGECVFFGTLVAAAVEAGQLFVVSRQTSTTDVITGAVGAAVGAWCMRRWRGRSVMAGRLVATGIAAENNAAPCDAPKSSWKWLAAAMLYALLLCLVFCVPLTKIHDARQIETRFWGFFRVPFSSLQEGSAYQALVQVVRKCLLFAPLGALVAVAIESSSAPATARRLMWVTGIVGCATLALAIEMLQVLLPAHTPDVTDVLLCTTGAAGGMAVIARLLARPDGGAGR